MMDTDLRMAKAQLRRHETPMDECTLSVTRGDPDSQGNPRPRLVILGEAPYQSSDYVRMFRRWLRQTLPEFRMNSQQQRWEAPIEALHKAKVALEQDWKSVWLSGGAEEYLQDGV